MHCHSLSGVLIRRGCRNRQVGSREERMGSTVEEFEADVSGDVTEQPEAAHAQGVNGSIALGIPGITGGKRSPVGCYKRRDRNRAVSVFAAPAGKGRNYSMAEARKYTCALALVI